MKNRPKVSIWCTAYNHEKYIKDALDGFIMQKTDFEYEIVVHDDASTDGTARILKEYEKKYAGLIRVIYQTENQYSKLDNPRFYFLDIRRRELQGEYIAWCEGDDYWTDGNKLQMQIDYMESHPECVMTAHDAIWLDCRTGEKKHFNEGWKERDLSPAEIIWESIPSASYVTRKDVLEIDELFLETDAGDHAMQLYCMAKGKIHYFDKVMSVYRCCTEGSWTSRQMADLSNVFRHRVMHAFFLEKYNKYTDGIYAQYIEENISFYLSAIPRQYRGLPVKEFDDICSRLDRETRYKMSKYFVEAGKLFRQLNDPYYLDSRIVRVIKKSKYVLIWGAGNYGRLLAEQLHNNGIDYEGFIVSDDQNADGEVLEKKIWRISELPYTKEEIGVIVAVGPRTKKEILTEIQTLAGIQNYIYPFEINLKNLLINFT